MVSMSEGIMYYCTVFLTAIVFLTEASAIATNYEKSTTQNKTNESPEISPQRTKLAPTRSRGGGGLSKNQNHDRVGALAISNNNTSGNKLKTSTRLESAPQTKAERELLLGSNSGGGENDVKDKGGGNADDDDQKTLSQQVADGKYGLIQHEIFTRKPARPGVLSYDVNPEVPKDNINNLGGLEPDDIWLAENHLLVLAGSQLGSMQSQWRPIDNYEAPKRQVQIPANPKVPPPFPVQLSEDGPIEYVKSDARPPTLHMHPFFNPLLAQYAHKQQNNTQGPLLYGRVPPISPYFPALKPALQFNPNQPPPSPIQTRPQPGAEFIPPYLANANTTEAFDEDDPSLYYPPPYDFRYLQDNTSKVPPGPLVPGIVLPPPPDFFVLWSNNSATKDHHVSKVTILKEKPRKLNNNNAFKAAKQLQFSTPSEVIRSEMPTIIETTPRSRHPPKYISFDDIINEVTYPDTHDDKITYADVKVNKVSTEDLTEDWIPIPAPKPYYITGEQKPSKNTVLVVVDPPQTFGYNYEKPPTPLRVASPKKPQLKYLHYVDNSNTDRHHVPTTPPAVLPPLANTKSSVPAPPDNLYTTTPISSYQSPKNTIKATYYFYEEPQFVDVEKTTSFPHSSTVSPVLPGTSIIDHLTDYLPAKPIGNYLSTPAQQEEPELAKPALSRPQRPYEKKRRPINPMIPIYYLAELENLVDLVKPMKLPSYSTPTTLQTPPSPGFHTSTVKPSTYTITKPSSYERPTPKPISEYNYVASGYDSPSAKQIPHSTPSPIGYYDSNNPGQYPLDYNAAYRASPQYLQQQVLYSPMQPQYSKPIQTTANPILLLNPYTPSYSAFDRPWLPSLNIFNQFPYSTENPYYAFFTKEEEDLIDENTKKYFTIFGQKIKQNDMDVTTPLSVKTSAPPTAANPWHSTKYGFTSTGIGGSSSSSTPHLSQSSPSNFYTSTIPYTTEYSSGKSHRRPPTSSTPKYAEVSSTTASSTTNRPLSLGDDTFVNYVTPLTEENLDAEHITPKISKHIRPIVVGDLPADLNERLKNVINLQRSQSTQNGAAGRTRYVLVDNEYDNSNNYDYDSSNNHRGNYRNRHRYQSQSETGGSNNRKQPEYESSYLHQVDGASKPISLESDMRVNYRSGLSKDPNAEYVAAASAYKNHAGREAVSFAEDEDSGEGAPPPRSKSSRKPQKTVSLQNDILVNYRHSGRYRINPDAEYIGSGAVQQPAIVSSGAGGASDSGSKSASRDSSSSSGGSRNSNNIVSYRYPDVEHGHFYFLTPQESHLTQIEDERYDFQSNVERPSSYFKRKSRDSEEGTTQKSEKSR